MPNVLKGTLHPYTARLLDEVGIATVYQGGVEPGQGATASAGYHDYCGTFEGQPFGTCADLPVEEVNEHRWEILIEAGVSPFFRTGQAWDGNEHIHAVQVGLPADDGTHPMLSGPRTQVVDYCNGLNGLVDHGPLDGPYLPNPGQEGRVYSQYQQSIPGVATRVYHPDGHPLTCYAWEEGGRVWAEVRSLLEGLGYRLSYVDTSSIGKIGAAVHVTNVPSGELQQVIMPSAYLAVDFLRAPVREVLEPLGYTVTGMPNDAGDGFKVYLKAPGG